MNVVNDNLSTSPITCVHQDPIALYPDHDIELTFDVEINVDDIRDVNTLRLLIYNALDGDVKSETLKKSFSEIKKSQVRFTALCKSYVFKVHIAVQCSSVIVYLFLKHKQ